MRIFFTRLLRVIFDRHKPRWIVTYPGGRKTRRLPKAEADDLAEIFGGTVSYEPPLHVRFLVPDESIIHGESSSYSSHKAEGPQP